MELEVKESVALEDGKHYGVVSRIEYKTEPYQYTDVFIKEKDTGFELKYGCPTTVSEKSKLGKLLSQFVKLEKGKLVDPEKVLLDKQVTFMTIQEETKDGTFNRVVDNSIKPIKESFEGVKSE